jgi:hypothetical protein
MRIFLDLNLVFYLFKWGQAEVWHERVVHFTVINCYANRFSWLLRAFSGTNADHITCKSQRTVFEGLRTEE